MVYAKLKMNLVPPLHASEMKDLGDLVKDVSRALAKDPKPKTGDLVVDWKRFHLNGQKGLVDLIRQVSRLVFLRHLTVADPRHYLSHHKLVRDAHRAMLVAPNRSIPPFLPT